MNIGLFNDNFPPVMDGVGVTVQNYAYWLHQKGQEVCVVTPYAPKSKSIIQESPFPIYRYPSIPIPMRKPYRYGLPQMDPALKDMLLAQPFELIHAHCPFTAGVLGRKIATKKHIPFIATFHSKYRQDFESSVPFEKLIDNEIQRIVKFYESADEVWIPQAAVESTLREYGFKGHVEVVENGNDFVLPQSEIQPLRDSMRAELGLINSDTMMLFVGQHIWEKNIAFILDALALIKNLPWHLYMIGMGYATDGIRDKITELGLTDKVNLVGPVYDRDVLRKYDAAADLFLFPSLYDNAPLVVREAAAMHTPSVMLQGSTASEVIQDRYNGFLSANDVVVYAELIHHLMEHPGEIQKAGDGAAATLARTWENIIDEVIIRYQDICSQYNRLHPIR